MAEYLVTGGAGFIGSNIVQELLKRSGKVRILDNFSTGKRQNLRPFLNDIELIEGDIRSYHIVREAVRGVDFILHQAALPSVPRSIKDPITTNEVNVVGILNVLDAAREAGVKRVVYASSSSIYGNSAILPKVEDMAPDPLSPYAVSKLAAEKYCKVFYEIYGLETVCLRYFNVFGPNQDPSSQYSAAIPKFITAILNGSQPTIYGDGEQSRDFTYVENVVEANLLACQAEKVGGMVLNIACGERITVNKLVRKINETLGKNVQAKYVDEREGEVKHSLASVERAKQCLGYEPRVSFEEGLKKTIEWYKDNRNLK